MPSERLGGFTSPQAQERFLTTYDAAMREWWPQPREEIDLDTRFGPTRVHHYRHPDGNGPPIVLLHGACATSASWAHSVRALAERHPVFAVDTIGEPGHSVQRAPIEHATDLSSWLEEVLKGLDLERAHLVGTSYGGWLALNQAVRSPGRLATITVLDWPIAGVRPLFLVSMLWVSLIGPDAYRRRYLRSIGVGDHTRMELLVAALRDYRIRRVPPAKFSDDELRSIRTPTLLLLGARSPGHDASRALARAQALLPSVQGEILPEARHRLPPEIVNARILDFAARAGPSGI